MSQNGLFRHEMALIHLCIGQEGALMMLVLENARRHFQEVSVTVVSSLDPKRKVKSAIPTMARRLGAQFYVSKPDSKSSVTEKVRNSRLGPDPDQNAKNGPE